MPDIKNSRRRFIALAVFMLVLDLIAAALLISPIGKGARAGQRQLRDLQVELGAKTRQVAPLQGIDQKVIVAKEEIAGFYDSRVPDSYSAVTSELGKVALANHVTIDSGRYTSEPSEVSGVTQVRVDFGISGDYLQTVKFINALERDKMFVLVNGVSVTESQGGTVRLQVHLETFVRSA